MGKPLYTSILLARHATEAAVQPEPPKPTYAVVEKWSRWNAFDPDSDEFFEADNAVYEAFLSDEEIAERRQAQLRESARLLVEIDGGDEMFDEDSQGPGEASEMPQQGSLREGQAPRRQSRRSSAIPAWRLSSAGEITPSIPRISVVPVGSREAVRPSSPEPPNLVSGLQHLSESPRPLIPVDSPPRPISPIPNTPARVSGVFGPPPSPGRTATTPSPGPTITPRVITWGPQSIQFTPQWVPDSPTPQDTSHFLGSLLPSTPVTY